MSEFWTGDGAWGIYGVVVGVVLTVCLDLVRYWLKRRSRGADLARRTVVLLDAYIEGVADAAERDSNPRLFSGSPFPDAPLLPEGVEWSSINKKLAYALLKLPATHARALRHLRIIDTIEDADEGLKERRVKLAEMAHAADGCALRLRKKYRLPSREVVGGWDPMSPFSPPAKS